MRAPILSLLFACCLANAVVPAMAAPVGDPVAAEEYVGHYRLSDGRRLEVTEQNGRLRAQIVMPRSVGHGRFDMSRPVFLKPEGALRFVSSTPPLQIVFEQEADGYIAGLRLSEDAAAAPVLARR